MKEIILLVDYKGVFGSKQKSQVYRGGMDIGKLSALFSLHGYTATILPFSKLKIDKLDKNNTVLLYTSNEDKHGLYKSYIEDIVFNLEQEGFAIIPSFACLKAHNNKVAMELMRASSGLNTIQSIHSNVFGTIEELYGVINELSFPVVIKSASGAMSRGVAKAENPGELIRKAKKISRSLSPFHDIMELLRKIKYRSKYRKESFFRSKFVVQNLIDGLSNDWKILVYGNKCFTLHRSNRKNDFRASGSGDFTFRKELTEGILDFAYSVKEHFNVPHISLDIGFDGVSFHLIEFQFLYFGTTTIEKSPFFFEKSNNDWLLNESTSDLEEVYVKSILDYLKAKHIQK
jgi:glutathione synthase/RimK-type ligase-like ATP-grasp enzyme